MFIKYIFLRKIAFALFGTKRAIAPSLNEDVTRA
jgi:hypothetical protein